MGAYSGHPMMVVGDSQRLLFGEMQMQETSGSLELAFW